MCSLKYIDIIFKIPFFQTPSSSQSQSLVEFTHWLERVMNFSSSLHFTHTAFLYVYEWFMIKDKKRQSELNYFRNR